jgi:hypothetical protein
MDEREAERLTQELFGVFVRRGMVLWAVATLVQLVTALPDVWAVQGIPVSAFVKPLAFGLGVGIVFGSGVCAVVVQFQVRRAISPGFAYLITGGSLGAIQGYVLGASLPEFLTWFTYPGVLFRPAQQRVLLGGALGTLCCYLLARICKGRVERKMVKYRVRGV